jgi:hypothetical protein
MFESLSSNSYRHISGKVVSRSTLFWTSDNVGDTLPASKTQRLDTVEQKANRLISTRPTKNSQATAYCIPMIYKHVIWRTLVCRREIGLDATLF